MAALVSQDAQAARCSVSESRYSSSEKYLIDSFCVSRIETLACDHTKVTPYFIESINSQKGFYAGPCRNLLTYIVGWCQPKDSEYVLMGEHCSPK